MDWGTSDVCGRVKGEKALRGGDISLLARKMRLTSLMEPNFAHDALPMDKIEHEVLTREREGRGGVGVLINTDDVERGREHWQMVWIDRDGGQVEYFDPYGLPPCQRGPVDLLDWAGGGWRMGWDHNETQVQSKDKKVQTCGYHCLHYLWLREKHVPRHVSVNEIVRVFYDPKDLKLNDSWAVAFVNMFCKTK